MGKRSILLLAGVILLASAVGIAIVLNIPWFPAPAFSEARAIGGLFNFILVVVVVIFVLVEGLLVYSLVRFRRRPGEEGDGPPVHGNTPLEIAWTVIPALIVLAIGIYSFKVLQDIEASPRSLQESLVVKVIARQWAWQFEYPEYNVSSAELHLPVGRSVEFQITSMDVIHSFWLPNLRQKMDALPGMVTILRATPTTPGDYEVICAELCGLGHAKMRARLIVEEGSAFQAWLEQQQAMVQGEDPLAVGRRLFQSQGCSACHTLHDAGSEAAIGPALDVLPETAANRKPGMGAYDYIRESIIHPDAYVVPGFPAGVMPQGFDQRMSDAELDALVRYLWEGSAAK